jgi:hypothetical protein
MATRRTTADKLQRERSKQQKAAAKRARRFDKSSDDEEVDSPTSGDGATTEELVHRMETLQATYDAGNLAFEEFDAQRSELLDRIALQLAE